MPLDMFSRRKREKRGEVDPLRYDEVDQHTRVRVLHVLDEFLDAIGRRYVGYDESWLWTSLCDILRKELGVFQLTQYSATNRDEFREYFLQCRESDRAVDCIELICKMVMVVATDRFDMKDTGKKAITEINAWLAEASIGYEFIERENVGTSQVIEISDRVTHSQIIVPALHVLSDRRFDTASAELLAAFDHLRKEELGDAISEAAKALETTLKIMAADKKWPHDPNKDTLKRLLDVAIKNSPVESIWQSHFESVRALLEAGVATARNRFDGHGQGVEKRAVPKHLAKFSVHQAASAILFFATANGYS